jgi:hypothetical protein
MAHPAEKLASSLEALVKIQARGRVCVRSRELSRTDRERLVRNGFLREVMKGWYIVARPDEPVGDTTAWYTSFWGFSGEYLTERFGDDWILSPDQSLRLHSGNWTVPRQLIVRAPGASNRPVELLYETAILDIRQPLPSVDDVRVVDGLRTYSIEAALVYVSESFFISNPIDARAVLATQPDAGALLSRLLDGGHTHIAGRLAGAFRNIGAVRIADEILGAMRAAGHTVRESDPFEHRLDGYSFARAPSPYVHRIRLMWRQMRPTIIARFPPPPARTQNADTYLMAVDDVYVTDAYHSLSIEGYKVTRELINQVRSGNWNPEQNPSDRQHKDAMAARGYFQCFEAVKQSLVKILSGDNPGDVVDRDHVTWYREMFGPSVEAGLIAPGSLAGYRNMPVYIRGSQHRPLNSDAVRDAMPAFFGLLRDEESPAVRFVLGHFIFVFIHPYMDGNGRIGRFLMNAMMAAGGYDWTVIPLERRTEYMEALEAASVRQDIAPFTDLLADLVRNPVR